MIWKARSHDEAHLQPLPSGMKGDNPATQWAGDAPWRSLQEPLPKLQEAVHCSPNSYESLIYIYIFTLFLYYNTIRKGAEEFSQQPMPSSPRSTVRASPGRATKEPDTESSTENTQPCSVMPGGRGRAASCPTQTPWGPCPQLSPGLGKHPREGWRVPSHLHPPALGVPVPAATSRADGQKWFPFGERGKTP